MLRSASLCRITFHTPTVFIDDGKADIDHIEGLSPAISIEQKSTSHNPRSTVGTITEIYDYLRLLFARTEPHCPPQSIHTPRLKRLARWLMPVLAIAPEEDKKCMLLAPIIKERKGEHIHLFEKLHSQGFLRVRVDGIVCDIDDVPALDKKKKHTIEVVVDRFKVKCELKSRLAESFETALSLSEGLTLIVDMRECLRSSYFLRALCLPFM